MGIAKRIFILWYRKVYICLLTTENRRKLSPKAIFLLIFWVAASVFSAALLSASEDNPSTDEPIIKTSEITVIENTVIETKGPNSAREKSILNTNARKPTLLKKIPRSRSEAEAAGWKTKSAQGGPVPVKNFIKEASQETKARQERLKAKAEKRKQRDKLNRQDNR